MKHLNVAVIGAGTAGLAVASLLQRSDHVVTLFEKFDSPKPLGAGLLIQPTGLSVLAILGLDQQIISLGSIIRQLYGKAVGGRISILDVHYRSYASHWFGVGTHRGNLFSLLYEVALSSGVKIQSATDIVEFKHQQGQAFVRAQEGEWRGPYDLVIDASGQKSALRQAHDEVKLDKLYPYGALWGIAKLKGDVFRADVLEQRYWRSHHMLGVLPVGALQGETEPTAAYFWSLKRSEYELWRQQPFSEWQAYATELWPETEQLIRQFQSHDDLAFASYRNVVLRQYHGERIVFIGDAAHCTSPQLGQGANLALVDALVLSQCLDNAETIGEALEDYNRARKKQLRFYQMASRALTPLFQSDSKFYPILRLLTCGMVGKLPFAKRMAAHVLTGTKTGVFTSLKLTYSN